MIPRCKVGSGVTGAVRYILGEGRHPETGDLRKLGPGQISRVAWFGGVNLGFEVETREDADLARRIMEFDALNQVSRTKRCEKDCVHLALGWRPGEQPTREQMEAAARDALTAMGMGNAKALFSAHNDEDYFHVHIVASKINPDTGRAYDLKGNYLKLSRWAEQYEREHSGGIVCTRRAEANRLRDAIDRRDAGLVLALMTEQWATFTARELERALAKQIKRQLVRVQFAEAVLSHRDAVRLSERAEGPATRYSSRQVLEAEEQVLRAADALARGDRHAVSDRTRAAVLSGSGFDGISREQVLAVRHATGPEGLALIDGQAGTGKSFTMAAIRRVYEAEGCQVVGLAPTNAVASDMEHDGFARARTVHSELFSLNNERTRWDRDTVIMVDEAAMIDTRNMAMLSAHAYASGAKLILVGDDRQLSSIERGGMFGVLKDRYGAAELSVVRRQHKHDDRRAAELMAEGNFHTALEIYDAKRAIKWTRTQPEARAALVAQWARDSAADPEKSRFVFAYTNEDVDRLNRAIRDVRKERGELGQGHSFETGHGRAEFSAGDRVQFTGTDKPKGLLNGQAGTVQAIDGSKIAVAIDGRGHRIVQFDAGEFKDFRHGYAGTIYRGQGRTLDQTYLYHSEHWRSAASYVALTRHRDKTELFVATNTAKDLTQLARQMGRVDERRAAWHFLAAGEGALAEPLSPRELAARLSDAAHPRRRQAEGGFGEGPIRANPDAAQRALPEMSVKSVCPPPADAGGNRHPYLKKSRDHAMPIEPFTDDELRRQWQQEADRLREAAAQEQRLQDFRRQKEREADEAREKDKRLREDEARRAMEGDIASAQARYGIALGEHYDIRDPYGSLARASMAEYAAFNKQQEQLRREIAKEQDAGERHALQLRKDIEAHEYMAVTSERLAGISAVIAGRENAPQAVRDRERAAAYQQRAFELREERSRLIEERENLARSDAHSQGHRRPDTARTEERKRDEDLAARVGGRKEGEAEMTDAKQAKLEKLRSSGAAYERHHEQKREERETGRGGRSR